MGGFRPSRGLAFVGVASLLTGPGARGDAVLPPHASAVKFKPCDKAAAAQQFKIPAAGETGPIVDSETGRCLAVLDCLLPNTQPQLKAAGMGVVVLDECGAGPCDGANQQWTQSALPGGGNFELVSTLTPTPALSESGQLGSVRVEAWKLMGTFNPEIVDNQNVVVQKINPVSNTAFAQTEAGETWSGLEVGSATAGGAGGGYGPTCPAGDHCCIEALPCVAPCSLPSSFGWNFIVILAVCSTVYVGGGIAYNHKVKGETLAYENARQLLPHMEYWQALGGLVSDGMSFSKTSWDAYRQASQAVAQVAGSVGGYESLADADEPPAVAKPASRAPAVGTAATSESSPFDAARSGSESDDGDKGGA